tara:strand:- start:352 stop:672 length:321 start_codon:yes stop_codon:yes gene_type:complete
MPKNILKNFLLTDLYENEEGINVDNEVIENNKEIEIDETESEDYENFEELDEDVPKIEFIVEEDENKEKQVRMNFEFKVNDSSEIIKIDLEISKKTYLELADELLK